MGGKVGKVLPLVAMAVATYFTGGAASAAAGAQAAGQSVATSLIAEGSQQALTLALQGQAAAQAALATATQHAAIAGLASTAIGGIAGSIANAEAQKRALAFQAEQQRVQQLTDRLAITQQEAAVQKNLRRVLAAQTVAFNAQGIDPGVGSPFALQEGAYQQARDDLDVLATRRQVGDIGATWNAQALASRRSAVDLGLGRSITGSLLTFGKSAISVVRQN